MSDSSGGAGRQPSSPPRKAPPGISSAQFAGVGLQFAITIVAFMFAGIWLDKRLGTSPWLVIVGVFVGAGAGFFSIYRQLMAAQRHQEEHRK
jgi:F0F1-type ATP synthase assembly protein I